MDLPVTYIDTPVGRLAVGATERGVCLTCFTGDGGPDRKLERLALAYGGLAGDTRPAVAALEAYFAGDLSALDDLPVDLRGTSFQVRVWRALRAIPAGETRSYGEVAAAIGAPKAVRAVGTANGANPVAIIVPCHRVVRTGGALGGYGGGLDRKRWLLEHEVPQAGSPFR